MRTFEELKLNMSDAVIYRDFMYFSNTSFNGLFKVNLKTREMFFVDFFPGEFIGKAFLHKRCIVADRKIFFFPAYAAAIHIYDIERGEITSIPFAKNSGGESIIDAVQYKNSIYVFPKKEKCKPLLIDTKTLDTKNVNYFDAELDKYVNKDNPQKFYRAFLYKDRIYLSLNSEDLIAEWNINEKTIKAYNTGFEHIVNLCVIEEKCYFTTSESYDLHVLEFSSGKISTYSSTIKKSENMRNPYGSICEWNNRIILVPSWGDAITELTNGNMKILKEFTSTDSGTFKFLKYLKTDDFLLMLPLGENFRSIYTLTIDSNEVRKWSPVIDDSIAKKIRKAIMSEMVEQGKIICETSEFDMYDFIENVF